MLVYIRPTILSLKTREQIEPLGMGSSALANIVPFRAREFERIPRANGAKKVVDTRPRKWRSLVVFLLWEICRKCTETASLNARES